MNKSSIIPEKAEYTAPGTRIIMLSAKRRIMQGSDEYPFYTEAGGIIDESE